MKAIAIDFDGTLCENAWPEIGAPRWDVIRKALEEKQNGAGLILWTCRSGELLENAVAACKSWGLEFDAINESLPEWLSDYDNDPRKIGASEYWDDRAVRMDGKEYAELRHAHWIDFPMGRFIYAKCSGCDVVHDVKSRFCPSCGAVMDEEAPE